MCVSTVIPTEVIENVVSQLPVKTLPNKFVKAKDKYMKLHEEMVNKSNNHQSQDHDDKTAMENDSGNEEINQDFLALSSIILRTFLNILSTFKNSKFYIVLSSTSQPAHVIMVVAVLMLTSMMMPTAERKQHQKSSLISFIYLSSFVVHLGSQIWMTFVSGLSLYFSLSRHAFGEVQRVLFPRYFTINAILSLTTLLTFVKYHPVHTWDVELTVQIVGMIAAFLIELLIRLYLVRPLLHLMIHKIALERAAGTGNEVGHHVAGPLKECPHYLRIHKAFRKLHMVIAMGNIITMACTVSHLYYISSKLCTL